MQISMQSNRFQAFGLIIHSEIPLPGLFPYTGEEESDVYIVMGSVPLQLENPSLTGVLYQVKENQFLLRIEGVASYLVEGGQSITIQPASGSEEKEIRIFLFTSVLGALLHQRGEFPLHASAVVKDGHAFAFCGPSGVGKSTLAAALQRRGYHLIADDITVVRLNPQKQPIAVPGFPHLKLWKDALNHLGIDRVERHLLRQNMEKYALHPQNTYTEVVPLKTIYCLGVENNQYQESLEPIKGHSKVGFLTSNTYRGRFLKGMEIGNRHFLQVNAIARSVRMVSLQRTKNLDRIENLLDLLEKDFQS
jgi:hypothetical protein